MSNVIIDLKNIDITFTQKRRTIQAVKDVSIQIEKGDIYGIVGYSGAGNPCACNQSFASAYSW